MLQKLLPKRNHKTAEKTGELRAKNIAEKIVNPKPVYNESSRNNEEIVVPPEKRRQSL